MTPQVHDHERAVLAALKLDNSAIDRIALSPGDFYDKRNAVIFSAIRRLIDRGEPANDLTLQEELEKTATVPIAAGYCASLSAVSAANIEYYAEGIRRAALRRKLAILALEIQDHLKAKRDPHEILESLDQAVTTFGDVQHHDLWWLREAVSGAIERVEDAYNRKGALEGMTTGFSALDAYSGGFHNGEMVIIGARPSIGKTALALTMALVEALTHCVGFFSPEMSQALIMERLLAMTARVNLQHIRTGFLPASSFHHLTEAASKLYNSRIIFDDTPNIRLSELRAKARHMRRRGAEILFVDYITLITHDDPKLDESRAVSAISKSLKLLARELEIPVVALSQVRREAEDRPPTLRDLRWSGSIEQDADLVLFLHRERSEENAAEYERETKLIIAKDRNGPVGSINLFFNAETVRFEPLAQQEEKV